MDEIEQRMIMFARSEIIKPEYPADIPTIEDQIEQKNIEIEELVRCISPRPEVYTKAQYLADLNRLESELQELVTQNQQIINDNALAKQNIDEQYCQSIRDFVSDPANIARLPPSLQEQIDTLMMLNGGV